MIELDNRNFHDFIKKNKMVVIDFWAPWCKPCFTVEKILKEIEKNIEGVSFAKMNTDENIEIARSLNILSLPTVMIFINGEVEKRIIGSKTKDEFLDEIEEVYQSNFL